jgi:hypothetical protein
MMWSDKMKGIESDNELERMIFVQDFERWKFLYANDVVEEGPGVVIKYPTTEDDFEQMAREWEGLN